jgi:glycosyltransferase involved in cell wall biosynthesis
MKIGIDLFPLKTYSFTRGIGKYSYNLVKHLIKNDEVNLFYLYNVPDANIQEFSKKNTIVSGQKPSVDDANNMDFFIITSLIELDSEVYLNPLGIKCKKSLIFYDLIPVIFWENYIDTLPKNIVDDYFKRLSYLPDFDLIYAISNSTKKDLIDILGIPEEKIKVIYAGLDENLKITNYSESSNSKVLRRYNIHNRFILTTPGIDFRKNISGLFNAFAQLNKSHRDSLDLVLVCRLLPTEENYLKKIWGDLSLPSKNLILTNYIPVDELIALYDTAELFAFPSLYEGFGLPVLEAMSRGCPVTTSNISSLPEICENAALYANPQNTKDIALSIEKILEDSTLKNKLIRLGKAQAKKFSWDRVALKVIESYSLPMNINQNTDTPRYKIALFTPLNPIKSGISDYSEELIPFLKKYMDIDIFIDGSYLPSSQLIKQICSIFPAKKFEDLSDSYDMIVYQVGNSEFHTYMIDFMNKFPGVMIQHDLILHGLVYTDCINKNIFNKEKYLDYVFENFGYSKYLEISNKISQGQFLDFFDYSQNFAKKIIDGNYLTLVHNHYSKDFLLKQISFSEVQKINFGHPLVYSSIEEKYQAKKEIEPNKKNISIFGRITKSKRPDIVLKAFSNLVHIKNICDTHLFLVGELLEDCEKEVVKIIKDEKIENFVTITGFVDKNRFNYYYGNTDVCVNLRYPSSGETSASIIKSFAYGIPTITSNYAQYKEYPDNCCWKLDIDAYEIETLTEYLYELISNNDLRRTMEQNALTFSNETMSMETTALQYLQGIQYAIKLKNIESSERGSS